MPFSGLKARDLDLTNIGHIKSIILEIEGEQNKQRKRDAWTLDQIKEGNQKEYVQEEINKLYPATGSKFRIGDINIVGKVDNKVSKAYKQQPLRICNSDIESEALQEIYKDYAFSRAFKEADSILNIHKHVCLWLTYQNPDEQKGIKDFRYVLHALKPYEYDLVRDQVTGEPIIFIQNYPDNTITRQAGNSDGIEQTIAESQSDTSSNSRIYTLWSKDTYVTIKVTMSEGVSNQKEMNVQLVETMPNILGALPVKYLQRDTAIDYPVQQNLGRQSIEWNVGFSDLKTASATQGHGQLVLSRPEGQGEQKIHMGMHTAITLPQSNKPNMPQSTAEYISASPNLSGQLEVLKFDIMNILDDHGIKAKSALEGGVQEFASGFDRLLSEADVQDIIEENQGLYADTIENGVFHLLKDAESAMNQNPFPTTEKISVVFEKPKVLISDSETLANIEKREELGTLLPWEKHIILNPNLSEEDAKKREEEIQLANEDKLKRQQELLGGMGNDEEDDEDEDNFNKEEDEEPVEE